MTDNGLSVNCGQQCDLTVRVIHCRAFGSLSTSVMQRHSLEEATDDSRGRKAVINGNPIIELRGGGTESDLRAFTRLLIRKIRYSICLLECFRFDCRDIMQRHSVAEKPAPLP
jgi:hypothetical protein